MAREFIIKPVAINWKVSFNLALLLHILFLSSALVLPKVLHRKPILPEIYSVDLVNILDSPAQSPAPAPSAPQPKAQVKSQPVKIKAAQKTAPIAPAAVPEAVSTVTKAVSLKPLKRKLKKNIPAHDPAQEIRRKKEAEQHQRELLAEAKHQKAIADAEARAAANEALLALRQSLRADAVTRSAKSTNTSGNRRSSGPSSSLEAQYFARIFSHLHQYWSLPDIKTWSPDLTAVVVVNISQNGRITKHSFESRSGDPVFDRFVSRTIQEANPLPAIPPALKKKQYTIGLRFRPGGIQ
ncbi:MAG: energy transducer TonB [Thermodesulfobacteriota bacterium]